MISSIGARAHLLEFALDIYTCERRAAAVMGEPSRQALCLGIRRTRAAVEAVLLDQDAGDYLESVYAAVERCRQELASDSSSEELWSRFGLELVRFEVMRIQRILYERGPSNASLWK